jgi:Spy/CpxP family protein refolding chaperone
MATGVGRWLGFAALAGVALGAGFGGAWLHERTMTTPSVTVPTETTSLHDRLHAMTQLSEEQDLQLDEIEVTFKAQKAELEAQMRLANRELADAMSEDQAYTPKVQAAIDHFHHAMGALQKASVEHVFAMRAVLTPAQQIAFDADVRSALIASSEAGENGPQRR